MPVIAQEDGVADSPELAWLLRVADGDRKAFEQLYQATAARLLGVCLRVLPDRAEAEHAVATIAALV